MPNLWFFNMSEEAQDISQADAEVVCRGIEALNARNLFNLQPADVAVYPHYIDESFAKYCLEYTGGKITYTDKQLFDSKTISELHSHCKKGQYTFQPYIQTQKALAFNELIGAVWDGASPDLVENGVITNINKKAFIKSVCASCGIRVAPHLLVSNQIDLLSGIQRFGVEFRDTLFIKKDGMCGGLGNLSGSSIDLSDKVQSWYSAGEVLLEPCLPLRASLGSFVVIKPDRIDFLGVDEQFFNGYEWGGFIYPYHDSLINEKIRSLSLTLAESLSRMGLFGPANFDWLLIGEDYPEASLNEGDIILSECNFRHTGVHPMMNFARNYYGDKFGELVIKSHIQYQVNPKYNTFPLIHERLLPIKYGNKPLLCSPNATTPQPGVVISQPPLNNSCGITIFAFERDDFEKYENVIAEALA